MNTLKSFFLVLAISSFAGSARAADPVLPALDLVPWGAGFKIPVQLVDPGVGRRLVVVEQEPQLVLRTIQRVAATHEWFVNEWVQLVTVHPVDRSMHRYAKGAFVPFEPFTRDLPLTRDVLPDIERVEGNAHIAIIGA